MIDNINGVTDLGKVIIMFDLLLHQGCFFATRRELLSNSQQQQFFNLIFVSRTKHNNYYDALLLDYRGCCRLDQLPGPRR
jgi:hypothetical protein